MTHSLVTVGPKSQVVIPKNVRKIATKIHPGKKVLVRPLSSGSVLIQAKPDSWVKETYGMHKTIWEGVEATDYIRTLREEWKQDHHE